jgi:hypothetical protein
MRRARFTILELFFATTFAAMLIGLFMSAWRVNATRSAILVAHLVEDQTAIEIGLPLIPAVTFIVGFAALAGAWGVVRRRHQESLPAADRSTPLGIRLCWGLMIVGGGVALATPILTMFLSGPLLFPTIYFSLLVGLTAIARGTAGDTEHLHRTAALQLANMLAFDPLNVVFAAMEYALLRTPRVRDYLLAVNPKHS